MQTWLHFWTFFFWISFFCFLFNTLSFLNLILYSEMVWLILYCFTIFCGAINDDTLSISLSFFILALASVELCLGFLLIILFKNFNQSIIFTENFSFFKNYIKNSNIKKINI